MIDSGESGTLIRALGRTLSGRSESHLRAEADLLAAIRTLAMHERFLADSVRFKDSLSALLTGGRRDLAVFRSALAEADSAVVRHQALVRKSIEEIERAERTMAAHDPESAAESGSPEVQP